MTYKVGVKKLLKDLPKIEAKIYENGDYDLLVILLDLEKACGKGLVTEKQLEIIKLVCVQGYTTEEAGEFLGVTRQAIEKNYRGALARIRDAFRSWGYSNIILKEDNK